jgi:integration host factor subunit alpha
MRINLTKKDLVNLVYMQLGFSKQISENLIEDFLSTIVSNIKDEKKLKLSNLVLFQLDKRNHELEEIQRLKSQK